MVESEFCQSCGMPLYGDPDEYGTHADGSYSTEYCAFCYQRGEFTEDVDIEGMLEICVAHLLECHPEISEDQACVMMMEILPSLKRWRVFDDQYKDEKDSI